MKKICCIPLALLLLTACAKNEKTPEQTTLPPEETTSLTLTEALTEEHSSGAANIEFAVFDPFAHSVKAEGNTYDELASAVEKISNAWAFFGASPAGLCEASRYADSFADTENPLEVNEEEGYIFAPLDPEIAATAEELTEFFRPALLHYICEEPENFEANLLGNIMHDEGVPLYKVIDGTLCVKINDVQPERYGFDFTKISVVEYTGDTAAVLTGYNGDDGKFCLLHLINDEEYGWGLKYWQIFSRDDTDSLYELYTQYVQAGLLDDEKE